MNTREKLTGLYIFFLLPIGVVAAVLAVSLWQFDERVLSSISAFLSFLCLGLIVRQHLTYIGDIRREAASVETAERFRAEQAETHVEELQHYVGELERSAKALRESRERFRHAAYHDALTGLANRNMFLDLLEPAIKSQADPFALLFLDLNRFKTVNDSLGHSVGDRLIHDVGERLTKLTGQRGTVGRFSGDEFAVLLNQLDHPQAAEVFAEQVAAEMEAVFELDGRQIFTSVSIGIAISGTRYSNAGELLRDADIAMYYAKETNKSYVVFDQIMHARAVSLLELETDLRLAVERDEFELYYQPLVNLDDVSLMGFEALVRWNHPSRGLITPGEFIEVAETTGLIVPMTKILLRSACEQLAKWKEDGVAERSLIVSVNLSAIHLAQKGIVDEIRTILFETKVEPENLKLEITESAVMENAESTIKVLNKIRDLGVKLSIDDFGTGYSSLSYLHRFPIDTLKIDRSFVMTMEDGSENGEIVRTVIALAKALNLSVIAEGIESIHQFHQLRILGCEFGQGYLFSRPVPATEAAKLLMDSVRWQNILPPNDFGVIARNLEYTQMRIQ
ncbi:MAG: EAL domain-containing protein [Pyrinomonadaceae bacterium]